MSLDSSDHARRFLTTYFDPAFFNDVHLHCSDGLTIHTHSLILASISPILRQTLSDNLDVPYHILLPDIPSENIVSFLNKLTIWQPDSVTFDHDQVSRLLGVQFRLKEEFKEPENVSGFACDNCPKIFSAAKLLKRHQRAAHDPDPIHVCSFCQLSCRSQSELEIHERIHTGEKPFSCEHCGKNFSQVSQRNDHIASMHNVEEANNVCDVCGARFVRAAALRRHAKIHKMEEEVEENEKKKKFECGECSKMLSSAYSLKIHQAMHAKSRPFECEDCGKRFSQKSHLTVHARIHTGERPHMCYECGKTFNSSSNVKKHSLTHLKQRENEATANKENRIETDSFSCEICGKIFPNQTDLQIHLKFHSEPPIIITDQDKISLQIKETDVLKCPQCNRSFPSKSSLDKHLLSHSGNRPHECPKCHKFFVQKSHLNHHLRTVHNPTGERARNHPCQHCNQAFASSSTLQKHLKTHTNERPFKCDLCAKAFIQKTHLQTHKLKHTGERPFLCGDCGKSFVTKSNLKEHSKVHTGEKKVHFCTECGAQYMNVTDLKVHLRRHTGEAPFACSHCSKTFRAKRHLADHIRTHTGQKPFHCQNCSKSFASGGGLSLHHKRNPTCRLATTSGAFSLKSSGDLALISSNSNIFLEGLEEQQNPMNFGKETVLVDFAPALIDTESIPPGVVENPEPILESSLIGGGPENATTILMTQQAAETLTFSIPIVPTHQAE